MAHSWVGDGLGGEVMNPRLGPSLPCRRPEGLPWTPRQMGILIYGGCPASHRPLEAQKVRHQGGLFWDHCLRLLHTVHRTWPASDIELKFEGQNLHIQQGTRGLGQDLWVEWSALCPPPRDLVTCTDPLQF